MPLLAAAAVLVLALLSMMSLFNIFIFIFFVFLLLFIIWWINPDLPLGDSSALSTCGYNGGDDWDLLASKPGKIRSNGFYSEYHGHTPDKLARLHRRFVEDGCNEFIFLIGDSTLDNKHWLFDLSLPKSNQMNDPSFTAPAINGYERHLTPARMVMDVAYHLNQLASQSLGVSKCVTLNASVEESTIFDRRNGLLRQDMFVRDHVSENDVIVVSVGGNDVVLRPSVRTVMSMLLLANSPDFLLENGFAPGLGHMISLLRGGIEKIVRELVSNCRPRKVIVCMLYYPSETPGGSWADFTLGALGYNRNPSKIQLIIRTLFKLISHRGFDVPGTVVEVLPFFRALDGKDDQDYMQRVEPSVQGGLKMARQIFALASHT
jgi:hypothetical protein